LLVVSLIILYDLVLHTILKLYAANVRATSKRLCRAYTNAITVLLQILCF